MIAIIKAWLKKNLAWLLGALAIFVMVVCFVSGCNYHKNRTKPEYITNTVILRDTSSYKIIAQLNCEIDSLKNLPAKERIKWLPQDTLFTPADTFFKDADTMAILRHCYSKYRYRYYKCIPDSLELELFTTVQRNMPIKYEVNYKILMPQTITYNTVDNSVNYSRYLYGGLDVPFYYMDGTEVELMYAFERGYIGGGYAPLAKSGSLKAGFTLFKFK